MNSRRPRLSVLCAVVLFAFTQFLTACGSDGSSSETTVGSSTSSSAADTTTSESATTSTTTVTTTTSVAPATTTSTTIAPVLGLSLSAVGLGDALFGADAEGVVEYVTSIVGPPSNDTGWLDPLSVGAACPGSEIRFVEWDDLSLYFSDESPAASGVRHFASYTYGPLFGLTLSPFGLTTDAGLGIGDFVSTLRAVYPLATANPDDGIGGPTFQIEPGLSGFLTGIGDSDTIISFIGGFGCGE